MASMLEGCKIVNYEVPEESVLDDKFKVHIRNQVDRGWIEVSTYQVKVDMHDVHTASMCYFDFKDSVEVRITGPWYIGEVKIRPMSKNIEYLADHKMISFTLDKAVNLSIEVNGETRSNLHLFAGEIPAGKAFIREDTIIVKGSTIGVQTIGSQMFEPCIEARDIDALEKRSTFYVEPGFYYIGECFLDIPSNTDLYLEGGAVLIGGLRIRDKKNISIKGRGILFQEEFHRMTSMNGIRISRSENISIEGLTIINPPHYSVYMGQSRNCVIDNIKAFSCQGWSDGIDIMSCEKVEIRNCFLRNSDDCIAIYGSRWKYQGDTKNVVIENCTLWADVAHPINMGTHGNQGGNDQIRDVIISNIDILEHNEYQDEYQGCIAMNAGDNVIISNILFKDVRIEAFTCGRLLDIRVKLNPDYNPIPGNLISNISLENVEYYGSGEHGSIISGFDEDRRVEDVTIENLVIRGKKIKSWQEGNIRIGDYTSNIVLK